MITGRLARTLKVIVGGLVTALLVVVFLMPASTTHAAMTLPNKMNFQGRLTDASGNPLNGNYNMQFKLYDAATGGTLKWAETRTAANSNPVTVTNGLFSVRLGEGTLVSPSTQLNAVIGANPTLYFEITVGTDAAMTPRTQVATSAYAFNADMLDGLDSTAFASASGSANYIQNQNSSAQSTSNFWISGTGKAATALQSPSLDTLSAGTLTLGGTNATSITLADNTTLSAGLSLTLTGSGTRPGSPTKGMLYFDTNTNQLIQYNGSKWVGAQKNAVIVAASNSTQAQKDAADYVATGSNDGSMISTALAAGSGGTVYLLPGTYTLGATSISIPNNTILAGSGNGTLLTYPNSLGSSTYYAIVNSDTGTGTGVTIRDLKIDGNKGNQSGGTFYGIVFNGMGSSGTRPGGTIENVTAQNLYGGASAIELDFSSGNTVTGNTANSNGNIGIFLYSSSGNTVADNVTNSNSLSGIYFTSSSGNTVTGNTVNSNGNTGIYFTSSSGNTVTGNTANSNVSYGISLSSSSANTISGNMASGSATSGILLISSSANNTVTGNTVSSNTGYGIILNSSSNNNVTSNIVSSNAQDGINANNSANSNTISSNRLHDNGGSGSYSGISAISSASSNQITDNQITDTAGTGYAINIGGGTNNYLSNNIFSGTGATSINDAGTNTIFAGQMKSSTSDFAFRVGSNSSTAFAVQNASGSGILTVDTSSSIVTITGMLNVISGYKINGTAGASTTCSGGQFLQNQVVQGGITTGGTCATALTAEADTLATVTARGATSSAAVNLSGGLTVTGAAINLNASSNYAVNIGTGTTTATVSLGGGNNSVSIGSNTTLATGKSITLVGGNTASRPASPTKGMLYFDTSTNQLLTYNGSQWMGTQKTAVIVAASNSTQAQKDAADYVASGSNDATTINSALTAGAGGTVYLLPGTYTLGATSISVPNNTILAGSGNGTLLTYPNSMANSTYYAITNTDTSTGTGVTIRDLRIDGNKANQSAGTFNGVLFSNIGNGTTRSGGTIQNVTIQNLFGSGSGIYVAGSGTTITGNTVNSNSFYGIYLTYSTDTTITGNTLNSNGRNGIYLESSSDTTVTGNTIMSNSLDGIYFYFSYNTTITGNTADSNGGYGFDGDNSYSNTITGNTGNSNVYGLLRIGLSNNNTITGNTGNSNSRYGIVMTDSSNNIVSSNRLHDNGGSGSYDSIYLSGNSKSNQITDNQITDTAGTGYAINVSYSGATNNYLSNNTFSGTGATSINDLSTNSIYGGQLQSAAGDFAFRVGSDSATAFAVQNAGGSSIFNVDTSSGIATIGGIDYGNNIKSSLILNNADTGSNSGAGLLISAGTTSSYIGGLSAQGSTTNATTRIRVASNGSLVNGITLQGSADGVMVGIGNNVSPVTTLDLGGGSMSTSMNGVRSYTDVYTGYNGGSTVNGTLEIILPVDWSNTFLRFEIEGYSLSASSAAWSATVGGYSYATSAIWSSPSVQSDGFYGTSGANSGPTVRLGYDSTLNRPVILVGLTSSTWNYPMFRIRSVMAAYQNQDSYGSGYSSAYLTSEANITKIVTPTAQRPILQNGNTGMGTLTVGTNDNQSLVLKTNNTARVTITGAGAVTIAGSITYSGITTGTGTTVCVTGSNVLVKSATTACTNPSSIAYKQNVQNLTDSLSILQQLQPVSFDWKANSGYMAQNGGSHDFGLIAQDVNNVLPQIVGHDDQGNITGVNYIGFIPFLIGGVQQQQQQITAIQNQLSTLQQSANLLNGGTVNGNLTVKGGLTIGSGSAGNTTGYTLVLDNKTNSGDPTGVAGAMYYSAASGNFRCYQAGTWQNCASGALYAATADAATLKGDTAGAQDLSTTYTIPANYCSAGRVIHIAASGVTTSATTAQPIAFGLTVGGTQLSGASPAITPSANMSDLSWSLDYNFTCRTAPSANATVYGQGFATMQTSSIAGTNNMTVPLTATSTSGTSIATNAPAPIRLQVTFTGAADAANTLTLKQMYVNSY